MNLFTMIELENNFPLSLYQLSDSSSLQLSYFYKLSNYNQIAETIRLFDSNQIARKLINFNNSHLFVLLESFENNTCKNSIYIYDIVIVINIQECKTENFFILDENIKKVNSMSLFDFIIEDISLKIKSVFFLCICAEIFEGKKGVLYIYGIVI